MDFILLNIIFTVLSLFVFLWIAYWAFSNKNKTRFEILGRTLIDNENGNE